jgi:hypothetical protein
MHPSVWYRHSLITRFNRKDPVLQPVKGAWKNKFAV